MAKVLFIKGCRLKIIYLHQYFNTPNMPGGTRSYEMARRLVAKGHEVHMVTSWREADGRTQWFQTQEDGIVVHWLPVAYSNHMSYSQRIRAFFRFALRAAQKAVSLRGDIVFATSTPLTIALPAVFAARRNSLPMVFEVRDLWPELPIAMGALRNPVLRWVARRLERWAYRHSESVVALSPGMRDGVVAAGYASGRVAVIPNSADNDFFQSTSASGARVFRQQRTWLGERPLLVYTGTFGRINGVSYLVELAARLRVIAPDIRVLLVGDGQEVEQIRSRAVAAGVLGDNLFIEGQVAKREIPALLAAADMTCSLFIDLPEMRANSANKFFDGLAAAKPIFLNYGGWQADLVEACGCGVVAWNKSLDDVAALVARCLHDRAWLESAGKAAQVLARESFDRDVLALQLERVLLDARDWRGEGASATAAGDYFSPVSKAPVEPENLTRGSQLP
ncbi:glycosyltransferase family 4 protein [Ectopseudomonas oleovorans]|uniref:glycosyltransferase family 4 protein n=1 Tax=Ectopseudomonas oleovorans TaxID=301 RepID=UPI00201DBA90|nr:glycosyltransferase family 4 protein [Pseudomonas oleovorans]